VSDNTLIAPRRPRGAPAAAPVRDAPGPRERFGIAAELRLLWSSPVGRTLIIATEVVVAALVAGLITLWPGPGSQGVGGLVGLEAEVERVTAGPCAEDPVNGCRRAQVVLGEGVRAGERVWVSMSTAPGSVAAEVDPGATMRVFRDGDEFYFRAIDHSSDLLTLVLIFGAVLIAVAGWQGARALLGLGVSAILVVAFVIPALRNDASPILIALVGAASALTVAALVTHGPRLKALLAILCAALLLPALAALAWVAVELTDLAGLSGDLAIALDQQLPGLSLSALAIAGMVIAASGALDDVVISQISTTLALPAADRFRVAMRVGRDHLAAAVNTLILSYAGASLPFLIGFSLFQGDWTLALSDELVATSIVAMLVGSLGLCIAVPISTAATVAVAQRIPGLRPEPSGHHH
jgi:uncharacterized membrane protein